MMGRLNHDQEQFVNGFGCFPDKIAPAKNTGTFIPDALLRIFFPERLERFRGLLCKSRRCGGSQLISGMSLKESQTKDYFLMQSTGSLASRHPR
jgi:hypothetical protein